MSISGAFQRQLQQLFHLHDSGLDQAFIDALPVFIYKDLMGEKEPFDCAVCLCEFSEQDMLRLLPLCSHAFHMDCIDTWLLSNSTCPLCRGMLFTSMETPSYDFDYPRFEDGLSGNLCISIQGDSRTHLDNSSKDDNSSIVCGKRVLSVRLGKYVKTNGNIIKEKEVKEVGETSNSKIDARRCFSMGSFQYVVANSDLLVEWSPRPTRISNNAAGNNDDESFEKVGTENCGNCPNDGDGNDKKISVGGKGESFSLSKIWLWSKKDIRSSQYSSYQNAKLSH